MQPGEFGLQVRLAETFGRTCLKESPHELRSGSFRSDFSPPFRTSKGSRTTDCLSVANCCFAKNIACLVCRLWARCQRRRCEARPSLLGDCSPGNPRRARPPLASSQWSTKPTGVSEEPGVEDCATNLLKFATWGFIVSNHCMSANANQMNGLSPWAEGDGTDEGIRPVRGRLGERFRRGAVAGRRTCLLQTVAERR